ncbi:MAG: hypothetical protein IPO24_14485 [Bacteroidetes bacterium]|nr:hypothetical protein [Bacteroidota bacterium]
MKIDGFGDLGLRLTMMPLPEWIAGWEADLKWDVDAPKKNQLPLRLYAITFLHNI